MENDRAWQVERDLAGQSGTDAVRGRSVPHDPDWPARSVDDERGERHTEVEAERPGHLHAVDIEEAALSDEEIEAYRRRVAEGFYNTREMAAEVARRMLRRGAI